MSGNLLLIGTAKRKLVLLCQTASGCINDNESGLHADFTRWLEKLAPEKPYSQYVRNGAEDNGDAHLKCTIMDKINEYSIAA